MKKAEYQELLKKKKNKKNPYGHIKKGKAADIPGDYFFKSAWERNYARYLNWLKKKGEIKSWEYEPVKFDFSEKKKRGVTCYTPDFRTEENDGRKIYHEVKGWMKPQDQVKLNCMERYYPFIELKVIGKAEYKAIAQFAKLIPGWE